MASVEFKNLSKNFGKTKVLHELSFTVPDKSFLVLLGPSGCGKTTLLRLLAGLEEPTSGDIFIDEQSVASKAPRDRDIAMVFQAYALYPHMSVFDNMAFGLKMHKVNKEKLKARVIEAAQILGIEHLLNRKPKALSGGQRQRVALGRAIVRKPKVFLMDEPLSNLDAKLRTRMRTELVNLHKQLGVTTVYVTHDQVEAMTMASQIVLLKDGVIHQIGSPLDLYERPATPFVASFIGSPPMNLFEGEWTSANEFKVGEKSIQLPPEASPEGRPQLLGIRPENIALKKTATDAIEIEIEVENIERLGAESLIQGNFGNSELSIKIFNQKLEETNRLKAFFLPKNIHWFSPKGERLEAKAA